MIMWLFLAAIDSNTHVGGNINWGEILTEVKEHFVNCDKLKYILKYISV